MTQRKKNNNLDSQEIYGNLYSNSKRKNKRIIVEIYLKVTITSFCII